MFSKNKTPLCQMTLNFGQKEQKSIKCSECDLFYNPYDKEDKKLHARLHQEHESAIKYSSLKGEKTVESFSPQFKCIVIEAGLDSKQSISKALQILDYVDSQLGINERKFNKKEQPEKIKEGTKFYLYVSILNKKVVGFCMSEHVQKAYEISYLESHENNSASFTYNENLPAHNIFCGVSRIWVASSMRRQGIATKLMDCLRLNFLYFKSLELKDIAFSDPTYFGQAFAKKYFNTNAFLIYNNA